MIFGAIFALASVASAADNTIRLDPATSQVADGATFEIKVIQNATIATSGSSATITFDKALLQVTSVTRGPAFEAAPLFLAGDATAIAAANKSGKLQNVAVAFFPPASVPAGEQELIRVGFKATGCGTVELGVPTGKVDATMLDGRTATYGANLKITTTGATVTVCDSAAASAGASAGASADASLDPGASGGVVPPASIDPNASPSPAPGSGGSPAPGATASAVPIDAVAAGSTGGQSGWLDFALASLAVAAAALAVLIIVLTLIAMTGAVVGVIAAMRLWRRYAQKDAQAAAAATTVEPVVVAAGMPGAPADGDTTGGPDHATDRDELIEPPTRTGIPLPTAQT